ncbi:MAG TPA: bacillithiol biosynthesis cysteine-adding enzyme BshC [Acidobacteriaceae bacterium]|nr:bacillithiol biosynthesis cysteine-adding enzyme BshC [Acidobacteriaceae bacterium]
MSTDCIPIASLPNITKLFRDFLDLGASDANSPLRQWYGADPLGSAWMLSPQSNAASENAAALADALERQSIAFGAGPATLANIAKLRTGARAVVTGQQVVLLGGPLLTLLKAATAVARARQATAETGVDHVPIFWLATEDHDFEEVDQVSLLSKLSVETLHLAAEPAHNTVPMGNVVLPESIHALLDQASELLHQTPICDLLRECYAFQPANGNGSTFASAIARLMTRLFTEHGLIVMDASGRDFHALGASTLRFAIEHAEELETALLARSEDLESAGYHAQVLVKRGASLLFLISEVDGAQNRQALHRLSEGRWTAGASNSATSYSTAELLAILDAAPERLSPNALLRAVFQDTILPTTAYVGGPAEVAYFAQSAVLYQRILGRITPILPRLSATLIEPAIAAVMAQHEVSLGDAMHSTEELAQRLAARALPIEAKRRLADAGNALDEALTAALEYLGGLDASLGRAAEVSASKMRYQMDRLRRLAATTEMQREASLRKHAEAMTLHLFPNGHLQERVLGGVWFLAAWESAHGGEPNSALGAGLLTQLVEEAASQQPDHMVIRL